MLLQLFVHAALLAATAPTSTAQPDHPPADSVIVPSDPNVTRNENGAVSFLGMVDVALYGESIQDQAQHYFVAQVGNSVELTALGVEATGRGSVAHFRQTVRGIPVEGTYAMAVVDRSILRYAAYLVAKVPSTLVTTPTVAASTAQRTGVKAMAPEEGIANGDPNLVIAFDTQGKAALAWRVPVHTMHPQGTFAVYVSATDNSVLGSKKTSRDAITGSIKATVNPVCEGDAGAVAPMPFVEWGANTYADAAGEFSSAAAPSSTATVNLTSPYLQLTDQANNGAAPAPQQLPLQATGNTPIALQLTGGPTPIVDTYYNFHAVRNWVAQRALKSPQQRAWVNQQVTVNVNLPDTCNAFYNPQDESLNLFSAGGGCANTGTIPLVLHHEYGHGVQAHSGNASAYDLAMTEGTADVVAIYSGHTDHLSGIAPGCAGALRTCANTFTYCVATTCTFDTNTEGHTAGQVICGVWNDLRTSLRTRYGNDLGEAVATELFLNYLTSINGTMPDSYNAAIAMDLDTDNNPANGTLHSCEINQAFKGGTAPRLPDIATLVPSLPSLAILHTAPGTLATPAPLQLTATLTPNAACSPNPKIGAVTVNYQVEGDSKQRAAAMQDAGNGNYTATLTDVQAPATVHYTLSAVLDGATFTEPFQHGEPADANGPAYQQTVRYAQEATLFSSDLEADNGGLVASTDNADGSSDWEWGTPATADTLTPHSGKKVWGTNLAAGGDVMQRRGRTSTLTLPKLDASKYAHVHVQYWSMLQNPDVARIEVNGAAVASRPVTSFFLREPEWIFHDVDVSAQAAGKDAVEVRFVAQNNAMGTEELAAWNLDNIAVTGSGSGGSNSGDGGTDSTPWGTTRGTCSSSGAEPWLLLLGTAAAAAARARRRSL